MTIRTAIPWLLFLFLCLLPAQATAQTTQKSPDPQSSEPRAQSSQPGTGATPVAKIDPEKEAAIRRLIALTGGTTVVNQVMDGMQKNMKPMLVKSLPPGEYRDKLIDLFFEKFRSKADAGQLVNMTVQVYDKYLSEEDINGLIQFYSTPLGQKAISVLPKLTIELQGEGMKWGESLGRDSMTEVLSEHPELRKALEEAARNLQSK